MMTKAEALNLFIGDVAPYLEHKDRCALRTAFNDWTDQLHKDGTISTHQYDTWILTDRDIRAIEGAI